MKIDPLFKDCLADVAPEIRSEVRLNMDIANRIYDILQEKNMTQREFGMGMYFDTDENSNATVKDYNL